MEKEAAYKVEPQQTNGNVKWPHFITTIIGIVLIVITFNVSKAEFAQFEKRFDDNIVRILDEIKGLKK